MSLLSSPYAFWLLPVALITYWSLPKTNTRLIFTALFSLTVLAIIHPIYAASALIVAASLWWFSLKRRGAVVLLWLVGGFVIYLLVGKYGTQMMRNLGWSEKYFVVPLGISYLVFRSIHFIVECHRGSISKASFWKVLNYLFFIPLLPAGPLETFFNFYQKQSKQLNFQLFNVGMRRVLIGLFKKLLLVDLVIAAIFADHFAKVEVSTLDGVQVLVFVSMRFLQAYIDLSAYTDIAIGLSALFGYRIMENFRFPLIQKNILNFWRSWHISLSNWCRDNVYFPVLGSTRKPWLAIYASMSVMGLWHAISLNWLLWGVYHATGILLCARWQSLKKRTPYIRWIEHPLFRPVGVLATFCFVVLGFSLVAETSNNGITLFVSCLKAVPHLIYLPV